MSRGGSVAHAVYISPAAYLPCSGCLGDLLQEKHGHFVGMCYTAAGEDNKVAVVGETGDVGFVVTLGDRSGDHRDHRDRCESSGLPGLPAHSNHSALGTSG